MEPHRSSLSTLGQFRKQERLPRTFKYQPVMLPFPLFFPPLNRRRLRTRKEIIATTRGDLIIPWFVFVALIIVLEAERTQESH